MMLLYYFFWEGGGRVKKTVERVFSILFSWVCPPRQPFPIFFLFFFLCLLFNLTLIHLPPLRFHCVEGCWDRTQHCEKSLFVLASSQKIPALRTEIPAVDTRTICLLPIPFFLNHPCQKSYGRKIPAFWCQKRQGRKIPASNYRYGRKIRLPVTTETAGKSQQETDWLSLLLCTRLQWRSGRTPSSLSEGRRFALTLCSNTFPLHHRKIPVAQTSQQKFQAHMLKLFLLYVRNESAAPGLGNGKSCQSL